MTPEVHILFEGYTGPATASTVGLVRVHDAEGRGHVVVIDPGMVPSQAAILEPLARLGHSPSDVTDVVLSHHHPDHTMNAGLFPHARVHDHWAIYHRDSWESRSADGAVIASDISLIETPGHSPQDISTLVRTQEGLVVFTHLWWTDRGPAEDPYATDAEDLHRNRRRILDLEPARIIPGHGPSFRPGPETPR